MTTSTRRATPTGVLSATGPATRVTSAPAAAKARARAKPIVPVERLDKNRTGSIASRVGPALSVTRTPARSFAVSTAAAASMISGGSGSRPGPWTPHASKPTPGSSRV